MGNQQIMRTAGPSLNPSAVTTFPPYVCLDHLFMEQGWAREESLVASSSSPPLLHLGVEAHFMVPLVISSSSFSLKHPRHCKTACGHSLLDEQRYQVSLRVRSGFCQVPVAKAESREEEGSKQRSRMDLLLWSTLGSLAQSTLG